VWEIFSGCQLLNDTERSGRAIIASQVINGKRVQVERRDRSLSSSDEGGKCAGLRRSVLIDFRDP
jgi:hypothetical protein